MKKKLVSKQIIFMLLGLAALYSCNKDAVPQTISTSPSGQLSRYDLASGDYDMMSVTTFIASYNANGSVTDVFEKSGQTLFSYSLSYAGNNLNQAIGSNLSVQTIAYNSAGKPAQINYTTVTDTGKLVFSYDGAGKFISLLDSVKQPLKLPVRYQYLYTYDAGGNNVVQITKNQLDLQGRPTLSQYSFFKFDTSPNPFIGFPSLRDDSKLPGDVPALFNKNNVTAIHIVGTILNTSSGGSVPTLDTITTYQGTRKYDYNSKGLPVKAVETFNDVQYTYSGTRTFTYDY